MPSNKTNMSEKKIIEVKKNIGKKEKAIIAIISCVIICAIIAGATVLGLYLSGYFEEETGILRTKDADGGYKKHYITGGEYKGVYAVMTINDGTKDCEIEILLMPEYAPITVNNFIVYAEEGFYDGTVIHRIVPETYTFQGGGFTYDTETKQYLEKASTHEAIKGEFASNPTGDYSYNKLSHFAGTISMARTSNNKNSATNQFFISWENYPTWDGDYACFGFIVDNEDLKAVKTMGENTELDKNGYPKTQITITKVEIVDTTEKD